jgi:nucleoid-associated protein YgaU
VKAGDTLQTIALDLYGDATRANLIFEANRDQIRDPDAIQVGMVLKIPPPP